MAFGGVLVRLVGARSGVAGCIGHSRIFGQGFGRHHKRPCRCRVTSSLKSDHVKRQGPVRPRTMTWPGSTPAPACRWEITAEFENWRRVRDLFRRPPRAGSITRYCRVAAPPSVTMKTKDELAPLYDPRRSGQRSPPAPLAGRRCWRRSKEMLGQAGAASPANGFDGWIEQQRLWGVYADEKGGVRFPRREGIMLAGLSREGDRIDALAEAIDIRDYGPGFKAGTTMSALSCAAARPCRWREIS